MWQEIAIIIIGLIVLLYIGRKIYKQLAHPPKAGDPCCGCTGCNLKDVKKIKNQRTCYKYYKSKIYRVIVISLRNNN